jgi:hypothetical protein
MVRPLIPKRSSKTVRVGSETAKGYYRNEFADAFERYLPSPSPASQPSQPSADGMRDVTAVTDVTANPWGTQQESLATAEEEALVERLVREYGNGHAS